MCTLNEEASGPKWYTVGNPFPFLPVGRAGTGNMCEIDVETLPSTNERLGMSSQNLELLVAIMRESSEMQRGWQGAVYSPDNIFIG